MAVCPEACPMLTPNTSCPVTSAPSLPVWTRPARRPRIKAPAAPRQWSRYERLSFSMLGFTWGILIVAVSALHAGNYHLDTRTSSTSGSHSGFYESARALKLDAHGAPAARQPASQEDRP